MIIIIVTIRFTVKGIKQEYIIPDVHLHDIHSQHNIDPPKNELALFRLLQGAVLRYPHQLKFFGASTVLLFCR